MNAIETTYRGYKFRSRLEAKWACVFEQLGWQWEYEPFDLNGYIPDFILLWPNGHTLAEVKPSTELSDLVLACDKTKQAGWNGNALFLGASVNYSEAYRNAVIGLVTDEFFASEDLESNHKGAHEVVYPTGDGYEDFYMANVHRCEQCNKISIHHQGGGWHCRLCGAYDGDRYLGHYGHDELQLVWARAHNETKWKPSR